LQGEPLQLLSSRSRRNEATVQPRGQLWFELERVCNDFCSFSGLSSEDALKTLVAVLNNLLAEQQATLERLTKSREESENPGEPRAS
jgi:hypothetical protein